MFKNLRYFLLDPERVFDPAELEERLRERRFHPCGPLDSARLGWAPPLGEDEGAALVHAVAGCLLLCARKQERLLPGSAVTEALDERIAELETAEVREVGRTERRRLKEQIVTEMLPRAFTRSRRTRLYLDTQRHLLLVDSASDRQAEEVVSLLRETLGSLPARLPEPRLPPATIMTGWLAEGGAPGDFVIGEACELRDAADRGGVVRCSGQDLSSEEIQVHLRAGKQAVKLALNWDERMDFILTEDLALKRLRLAEALLEETDGDGLDPAARLDAEFAILSLQLRELLERLAALFEWSPSDR